MQKNIILLITLSLAVSGFTAHAVGQPNVLIIMADDCTYNDLPLFGGQNAKTPNIDRLAAQARRAMTLHRMPWDTQANWRPR